jgi:hypothetical protein
MEFRPRGRGKSNLGNSFETLTPWVFAATLKQLLRLIGVNKRALEASEIEFERRNRKNEASKTPKDNSPR